MWPVFTFFVQETFLMQMPGQPPAERQRGQQRSSLMGEKNRVSVTFRKVRVDAGPVVKGCRPNGGNVSFPEHAHKMFNAARTEYKPRGLTNIYPFIEYSAVLIAIQKEFGIPSLWLCMVLNGLDAFLNRKLSRNNRYQVTTGIKSHSEL